MKPQVYRLRSRRSKPLRHRVGGGSIPLLSHTKRLKNSIQSFPAWRLAFKRGCGEQAGQFDI